MLVDRMAQGRVAVNIAVDSANAVQEAKIDATSPFQKRFGLVFFSSSSGECRLAVSMQGGYSGVEDRIAVPCLHRSPFILCCLHDDDDLWSSLHIVRLSIYHMSTRRRKCW